MSGPIKLHYLNAAALGEPIRFILHYGGIKFTDERIMSFAEFGAKKDTYPYGQVPILEIEGKTIHQTKAICRYLARKVGLVGKTEWDALECDIMVDTIDELRDAIGKFFYEKHPEAKAAKKELLISTTIPYYLTKLEAHLAKNSGHFVNGQLTWADFYFAGIYEFLSYMIGKDIFEDQSSSALKAIREKVITVKGVKEYMAVRPPAFSELK